MHASINPATCSQVGCHLLAHEVPKIMGPGSTGHSRATFRNGVGWERTEEGEGLEF